MAGNRVEYIIDLVANDKQLRQSLAKIDWGKILGAKGKGFSDVLKSDAEESKQVITSTLGGLHLDWSSILGEKDLKRLETLTAKVVSANADKLKGLIKEGDISGIQNVIDLVSTLGNELKALGASLDVAGLARSMGSFMKILSSVPEKFNKLASEPQKVANAFNLAFNDGKWANNINKTTNYVGKLNASLQRMGDGNLDTVRKNLRKLYDEFVRGSKLPDYSNWGTDELLKEFFRLDEEIDKIESKMGKRYKYTQQEAIQVGRIMAAQLAIDDYLPDDKKLLNKNQPDLFGKEDYKPADDYKKHINDVIDNIITRLNEVEEKIKKSLGKSFAEVISEQISDIQLSLTLPDEKKFINDINKYVDDLNASGEIKPVNIGIAPKKSQKPQEEVDGKQEKNDGESKRSDNVKNVEKQIQQRIDALNKELITKQKELEEINKKIKEYKDDPKKSGKTNTRLIGLQNRINENIKALEEARTSYETLLSMMNDSESADIIASDWNKNQIGISAMTAKQNEILAKTEIWRSKIIKAMSISSKDLTFDFSGVNPAKDLYNEIEEYFNESPINITIDTEGLSEQIRAIVEKEGINLGSGGVANIDPKVIASAVYAAITAAFTGEKMPSFDYSVNSDENELEDISIDDNIDEATESSKKYVKQLDETTIHIDEVIKSLKEFAKIATATKKDKDGNMVPAASTGVLKAKDWLTTYKGIDIEKIASGEVNDTDIRQMLQDALLTETEDGYASGSAFVDILKEFIVKHKIKTNKGSGAKLEALRTNIDELFKMLEINQESADAQSKRYKGVDVAQNAISAGQSLNLLNKVRGKLNPKNNLKRIPTIGDIQKVIDDFVSKGINTDDLEILKTAREALGDATDNESIETFRKAAYEFYEKSRSIFDTLNTQFGDFQGRVNIKGSKKNYDISKLKDVYTIPKNAVIVNAEVYKYIESKAVDKSIIGSTAMRESSWRKARRQEQSWLRKDNYTFTKADYLSNKPDDFGVRADILSDKVNVSKFVTKEEISGIITPLDLDASIEKANNEINNADAKLKENEAKLQELDAKIKNQDIKVKQAHKSLDDISETRASIDQSKVQSLIDEQSIKKSVVSNTNIGDLMKVANDYLLLKNKEKRIEGELNSLKSKNANKSEIETKEKELSKVKKDLSVKDIGSLYPDFVSRVQKINSIAKEREKLQEQLRVVESLTVDEAKKRLKSFEEDEMKLADLKAISPDKLTGNQRKEISSLQDLVDRRANYKTLYQEFIKNPDATKINLQTSNASLTQQENSEKSAILEWARSEVEKLPQATAEIEKAAKPIISEYKQYLNSLYTEAIEVETKLSDKNLSDTDKNALLGHLQNILNFIKETQDEYSNFAKKVNGPEQILNKKQLSKISSLTDTYVTNTPSVASEAKEAKRKAESELQSTNHQKKNIELENRQLEDIKQSKTLSVLRYEKQKEYNSLKEKEVDLQNEIIKLEDNDPGSDKLKSKKKELDAISAKLIKIKNELKELGGQVANPATKPISNEDKKGYALDAAKQYQDQIIKLTAQKYVAESQIKKIDERKASIKKYGFGSKDGIDAKRRLISEFEKSDYYTTQQEALREKTKADIEVAKQKSQELFDKKVAEAMKENGFDSTDKTKFLNTKEGQALINDFNTEVESNTKAIWAQYDTYKKELHKRLIEDFTKSFKIDKQGMISATFKKQSDDGEWIDDVRGNEYLKNILAMLGEKKKDLKKQYKVDKIDSDIAYAEEQKIAAMAYGGLDQSDILNKDLVEQQIRYQKNIINNQGIIQQAKEKINVLEEAGLDKKSQEIKEQNQIIEQANEEIARNQILIDNRDKLIELRKKEKEGSKLSDEEQRILATERLQKAKDNLAKTEEKILKLKQEYKDAKGTDNEMLALRRLDEAKKSKTSIAERIAREEKRVGYWSRRVENKSKEDLDSTDGETTSEGGILGVIKAAVREAISGVSTNVEIDTSHLATEETLQAIYALLGGGGDTSDSERAALEEELAKINKELEGEGFARSGNNSKIDDDPHNLRFVYYGSEPLDIGKIQPIKNAKPGQPVVKPRNGSWAAPITQEFGDEEWPLFRYDELLGEVISGEKWLLNKFQFKSTYEIDPNSKILIIDNDQMVEKLPLYKDEKLSEMMEEDKYHIDFEKLATMYDGMYVRPEALTSALDDLFYGWDVNSLVVFNKDIIKNLESVPIEFNPDFEHENANTRKIFKEIPKLQEVNKNITQATDISKTIPEVKESFDAIKAMSEGMETRISRANALSQAGVKVTRGALISYNDEALNARINGENPNDIVDKYVWPQLAKQFESSGYNNQEDLNKFYNILESLRTYAPDKWKSITGDFDAWIRFQTDNDVKNNSPITKKGYGTFANIGQLSQELINEILTELVNNGFKGQVKIPDSLNGFFQTDQIVAHASDTQSFEVISKVFSDFVKRGIFSSMGTGVDTRGAHRESFSTLLESIYGEAPGQTFTVDEIKAIITAIAKDQNPSQTLPKDLVKSAIDNVISKREVPNSETQIRTQVEKEVKDTLANNSPKVPIEPEIAPGAVDKEVKKNVAETPAEIPVKPTVEKTDYQKAVETVHNAIGDFSLRTSNANKAEKYNSLGQEVKDAAEVLRTTKEGATNEGKKLLDKIDKLSIAANKVVETQVQQSTEEADEELDPKLLTQLQNNLTGLLNRIDTIENRIAELENIDTLEAQNEKDDLQTELVNLKSNVENTSNILKQLKGENLNNDKSDLLARKAEIEGKLSGSSSGGIVGIMRTELAKESTLQKVLSKLGEIAKKNVMSGKPNSAQDLLEQFRRMLESDAWEGRERVAYMDLATGSMSNAITGNDKAISTERLRILREAYASKMDMNAQVHTHANADDPYFSPEDLKQFGIEFANGITKQILLSKNNMTVLDMTDVKDVDGLLEALSKTEQNFEALATTADKFGAKYTNKSFDSLTPQGLVKMLGIKGIESKLNQEETRDSAFKGVAEEEAKEAAKMLQDSTGRAVKTTVQRVGLELETLVEKTDTKGNKTWTSEINNKYQKAMEATNKRIAEQNLGDVFGKGTNAAKALTEYETHYNKLLDLVTRFKSASKEEREGLQAEINALLPTFNEAEKKLISLIARKDKFIGDDKIITTFSDKKLKNTRKSLEAEARKRYGGKLNPGSNVAFGGYRRGQGSGQLYVDVLKEGTIKQYVLEVDQATGQVKEYVAAENALANAFQNVNKAMKQNEYVLADVAIGNTPEEQATWMANASAPQLDAYKKAFTEMQDYTAQLWNSKGSPTQEQLDYLMQLSERVIILGKDLQKTSGEFKNFWAQNPDNVVGIDLYEGDTARSAMERYAKINATANSSKYEFASFDNNTLKYKLTDVEGNVRNVSMVWDELYQKVAIVSDKSVSALDPLVKKIEDYKQVIADAKNNSYLLDTDDAKFNEALKEVSDLEQKVRDGAASFEQLEAARRKAIGFGDATKKLAKKNEKLYTGTNEIRSAQRQYDEISGTSDVLKDGGNSSIAKKYISEYKALLDIYKKYASEHKLNDPQIQEQLRQQAAGVKKLGRELNSSAREAQTLQDEVKKSELLSYTDKKGKVHDGLGGSKTITPEEAKNMQATMQAYAREVLNADLEHVKFNSTTQTLEGTLRKNNYVVGDMIVKYNDATESLYLYQKQERESLSGMPAFLRGLKEKSKAIMQYLASMTSIYRVVSMLRQGVQYIKEIDSALTELKKVTDETDETYNKFLKTAAKTADKVGSTIKDVVSSTADWARLGYSIKEAAELAESTQILMNVSEFTDVSSATDSLISSIQAFKYTANESMDVVDILNTIGKQYCRGYIVIYN